MNPQDSKQPRRLLILGATGSIGQTALDVVADFPEAFQVVGLAAHSSVAKLQPAVQQHRPASLCFASDDPATQRDARQLAESVGARYFAGAQGLVDIVEATDADIVLVATVGFAGLLPTLAAIRRGMTIALANKEVLVTAGDIVMAEARTHGVEILPVDSEHNAIFQCLASGGTDFVRRLVLTASGGPFLRTAAADLAHVTPEAALCHPTWTMGPKITIDSSTLMNKGFEVIEAAHLFGVSVDSVDVVVHPESTVHSMVEFVDGSVVAQMGVTNMYLPILHTLMHPQRQANKFPPLCLATLGKLTFEPPDTDRFPCLRYAYEAARRGNTYPTVLNAANEIAVQRFLNGEIPYLGISDTIKSAIQQHQPASAHLDLEAILAADEWARNFARNP